MSAGKLAPQELGYREREREREKERVCSAYTVLLFICRCFYPSEVRVVSDCLPVCLSVCLSLVFAASDEDQ